jgi:putative tryptophan/tyrosine transport system substrate-binding protein
MQRRALAAALGAAFALPSLAQPARRRPLVAGVYVASEAAVRPYHEAFLDGLRERGLVPGRDLVVDARHADGDAARLPALVDEVIALKPDLLFGIEAVAVPMRRRTTTIPIVVTSSVDPVAAGLVLSLRRPGTNVTGMANLHAELQAKQIDLLTEVVPGLARVALLVAGTAPGVARYEASARETAAAKGLALVVAAADDAMGLDQAFAALSRAKPQALVVASTGAMQQMGREVAAHARRLRLPSISGLPAETWISAGGLIAYAPDYQESNRKAAGYVERILRGADPAELPVEQSSRFQFWINLETARAIGLAIPKSILLRADKVIE